MIGPLIDELAARRPVVIDGAWRTHLQSLGLPTGQLPDRCNVSRPDLIEAVASSYVAAGSRIVLTNTFHANRLVLGAGADVAAINREGARISRRAAGARASVFGSIGPLPPNVDDEVARSAFGEQAEALARGGADAIVVESMSGLDQAAIAVTASLATGLPVVACMTFDDGEQHDRTATGVRPAEAARRLADAGAAAVGANCGRIDRALPVCDQLVAATDLPVWVKAGTGGVPGAPDDFARHVLALVAAGASFVGGCCGTSPEHVAAIAETIRSDR